MMMKTKITSADIQNINGEPRISSMRLAEAIGYEDNIYMRRTIDTWMNQLLELGAMPSIKNEDGSERAHKHYMLNERQAWIACMFARTREAREVRAAITKAFAGGSGTEVEKPCEVERGEPVQTRKRGRPAGWVPLSDEQVSQIRSAYASGEKMPDLAQRYGIGEKVVENLILGETYRHVRMSEAERVAALELELIRRKREIRRLKRAA